MTGEGSGEPAPGRLGAALRALPSVERLARLPALSPLSPERQVDAARYAISAAREALRSGTLSIPPSADSLATQAMEWAASRTRPSAPRLRAAVNATGVILHTNLGRATLAESAVAALLAVGQGHAALEIDAETGGRGSRQTACAALLRQLTGAEDALIVNNAAAATYLAMNALAGGGEVVLSRGQMIEIGGQFRLTDVIESAGARLREVGTTNRTRISDYAAAVNPQTAMLLRVHPSNFRVVGFTEEASLPALVALGRTAGVMVGDDIGSGALIECESLGLAAEPTAPASIAAGADLVWFSGDKLLGGPQAGILIGRSDLIARLSAHPLYRALRPDKLALAALEATLLIYRDAQPWEEIPTLRRLCRAPDDILAACGRVARMLRHSDPAREVDIVPATSTVGGGSLPGHTLASWAVAVDPSRESVTTLARRLRNAPTPVFGRIEKGKLLLDLRCVDRDEENLIDTALQYFPDDAPEA